MGDIANRYKPIFGDNPMRIKPQDEQLDAECLLLSYPKSGNTWARYIAETISDRPTIGYDVKLPIRHDYHNSLDHPIYSRINIFGDHWSNNDARQKFNTFINNENILLKRHTWDDKEAHTKNAYTKLILIVRNYKECLLRNDVHIERLYCTQCTDVDKGEFCDRSPLLKTGHSRYCHHAHKEVYIYLDNIERFDEHKGPKLLIYYENLLMNPKDVIYKLTTFFNWQMEKADKFVSELQLHEQSSVKHYIWGAESAVQKDPYWHSSKKLNEDPTMLYQVDVVMRHKAGALYSKYLERYAEKTGFDLD
jgi:hypothetical protein